MSIDNIAGLFLGKNHSEFRSHNTNESEKTVVPVPLVKPITQNPDAERSMRNRIAELQKKVA